jgi:hypothetical protein
MRADDHVAQLRRRLLCARVHRLGARPTCELIEAILELVPALFHEPIDDALEQFARIDPDALRASGGNRFAHPPLHAVPTEE